MRVFLLVLVGFLIVAATTFADEGVPPRIDAILTLVVPDTIKLNTPFEVECTFETRVPLRVSERRPDQAVIVALCYAQFVSGDTLWTGHLNVGEPITLRATYIVTRPEACLFQGHLTTMGEALADPTDTWGGGAGRHVNGVSSRLIRFPDSSKSAGAQVLIATDSGLFPSDDLLPPLPVPTRRVQVHVDDSGNPSIRRDGPVDRPFGDSLPSLPIRLTATVSDTVRISYQPGRTYKFLATDDGESVAVTLVSGDARFQWTEDKVGRFYLDSERAVFRVTTPSLSRIIVLTANASSYRISSQSRYVDRWGNDHPNKNCRVDIWYYDADSGWIFDGFVTTLPDGTFSFPMDRDTVGIYVISENFLAFVCYDTGHAFFTDGLHYLAPYYKSMGPIIHYSGDVALPPDRFYFNDINQSGAFNIIDVFQTAWYYMYSTLDEFTQPDQSWTIWDFRDSTCSGSKFWVDTIHSTEDIPFFGIGSRATFPSNWDEWDASVLLHEYGHFVQYYALDRIPGAVGDWYYGVPAGNKDNPRLAFSEGWVTFFSGAVRNDPVYRNTVVGNDIYTLRNFEQPTPDVPYYASRDEYEFDPVQAPHSTPQFEGAHIAGAVVNTLWDMDDAANDDNFYWNGTLWGHNNDHNSSTSWRGIEAIWDVMKNYDPRPDQANHNHCWSWYEFCAGWYDRGYPVTSTIRNLAEAHGVPFIIPGNIDESEDNLITMGDLTVLIDHLYVTLNPLRHPSIADLDGDCSVTMGDLTVLIDVLFITLDLSVIRPGCVDMY